MKCTICAKPIEPRPQNQYAPFCSSRCRMADLGNWLAGSYAIPMENGKTSLENENLSEE